MTAKLNFKSQTSTFCRDLGHVSLPFVLLGLQRVAHVEAELDVTQPTCAEDARVNVHKAPYHVMHRCISPNAMQSLPDLSC